jgi:hypothetical protein
MSVGLKLNGDEMVDEKDFRRLDESVQKTIAEVKVRSAIMRAEPGRDPDMPWCSLLKCIPNGDNTRGKCDRICDNCYNYYPPGETKEMRAEAVLKRQANEQRVAARQEQRIEEWKRNHVSF